MESQHRHRAYRSFFTSFPMIALTDKLRGCLIGISKFVQGYKSIIIFIYEIYIFLCMRDMYISHHFYAKTNVFLSYNIPSLVLKVSFSSNNSRLFFHSHLLHIIMVPKLLKMKIQNIFWISLIFWKSWFWKHNISHYFYNSICYVLYNSKDFFKGYCLILLNLRQICFQVTYNGNVFQF